ncbi:TetR/AcrR family transcriptional regulator [Streptomyces sp. NBC_00341]|uniref:TetR/AcrR family transcriptional regulator n=1 Tax=unclassified Streptomyces TaxID=2593676 RepID=UPI000AC6CB95|nr:MULTISPECIES: TetR/AcrR family transcriptional regulator [unclassified Streptomyces]WRZ15013.1 TetR/AcrR family transcriptional regulator [Streptomyces sp. NBC_00341]
MTDYRTASAPPTATRRRGAELTQAIYRAALEELAASSFEELSFEKIAPRAGTGKSVLYRRWSTTAELVLAALKDHDAGLGKPLVPDTGALREDLLVLLIAFARVLDEPRGRALRPLLTQRPRHPELFAQVMDQVILPHQAVLLDCMRRAVDRGEAGPDRATARTAAIGPRLIVAESIDRGTVPDTEVEAIVDEVLLPLLARRG